MIRTTTLALAAALFAAPALAQGEFQFDIDQAQSNWTFGGTTSLGPIQGNPNNTFQIAGTADASLFGGGDPISSGQLVSSNVTIPGGISAQVPNPLPFFPPLATFDLTNLVLSITTDVFAVPPGGLVSTDADVTIVSGQIVLTAPIVGTQTIDLGAQPPSTTQLQGFLTHTGNGVTLDSGQIAVSIDFTDPTSGISATIDIAGALVANYSCPDALVGDVNSISLLSGGTQNLSLNTCLDQSAALYFLLGSASGTAPGLPIDSVVLPLAADSYFNFTLTSPNSPPLGNSLGLLDASGLASASFNLPIGLSPGLAGLVLNHAYLVFDGAGAAVFASNAASIAVAP